MGKLINLNGDADELAELLSESEDTDTDSAGMDALTEALDALEDAAELIDEVLD